MYGCEEGNEKPQGAWILEDVSLWLEYHEIGLTGIVMLFTVRSLRRSRGTCVAVLLLLNCLPSGSSNSTSLSSVFNVDRYAKDRSTIKSSAIDVK